MATHPSGFAVAAAALAREAARLAQGDDRDVRLSPRTMDAAMRAAEDLAAVARAGEPPQESYDAAEAAVQTVAAELASARGPRRLLVVLEVQVDEARAALAF